MADGLAPIVVRQVADREVPHFASFTFPAYFQQWQARVPMTAVGAYAGDTPVGLALALRPADNQAEALSLFVAPAFRGQGLATTLLGALEGALLAEGARVVTCTYTTGTPSTPAVERVLARAGWAPPVCAC